LKGGAINRARSERTKKGKKKKESTGAEAIGFTKRFLFLRRKMIWRLSGGVVIVSKRAEGGKGKVAFVSTKKGWRGKKG